MEAGSDSYVTTVFFFAPVVDESSRKLGSMAFTMVILMLTMVEP